MTVPSLQASQVCSLGAVLPQLLRLVRGHVGYVIWKPIRVLILSNDLVCVDAILTALPQADFEGVKISTLISRFLLSLTAKYAWIAE